MEFRIAYGVLLLLLIIGRVCDGVAILKIKADVDEMRKEMLALLKKTTDDSNRYMDEWGSLHPVVARDVRFE